MKRINILKGIEKILINKAYETGHISHRADGDWQKQADGSWTPYTGQSTQSTSQAQEPAPTENAEYGEITEEDLVETSATKDMSKHDVNDAIDKVFTTYDEDAERLFGTRRSNELKGGLVGEPKISYGSGGKIVPADRKEFDKIVHFYMDKAGVEDTPENYKHAYRFIKGMAINNHLLNDVNKSYRDMRSTPTTKNMGF